MTEVTRIMLWRLLAIKLRKKNSSCDKIHRGENHRVLRQVSVLIQTRWLKTQRKNSKTWQDGLFFHFYFSPLLSSFKSGRIETLSWNRWHPSLLTKRAAGRGRRQLPALGSRVLLCGTKPLKHSTPVEGGSPRELFANLPPLYPTLSSGITFF